MELWDLYDLDRMPTGKTMIRGEKVPENYYRMVVHICIIGSDGKLLIQQRQPFKKGWAGMWDVTVGGSAIAGDTSRAAAEREVREEIGLEISLENIRPVITINFDNCFDDIYVIEKDVDISKLSLQESEVKAVKWASCDEVLAMIESGEFIPYYKALIELLFSFHRDQTHCRDEIMLVSPSMKYADEIMAYKNEQAAANDGFDGCGDLAFCQTAEEWLDGLERLKKAETCPEGYVESDTYLAVRSRDERVIGIIDLRHNLNSTILSEWGGHIGYSVRPSERRKGYATKMLEKNLINAKRLGLEKVMITCTEDNVASEKVIIANGGVYEKTVRAEDMVVKRFWIDLQ